MPKLSVIVPVYNTEKYLNKCIDSILEQTFTDFELIIVDDHSPGNCKEIIKSYDDPRIKYIKSDENNGTSISRHIGVQNAVGEYLAFCDPDDFYIHKNVFADLLPMIKDADILSFNHIVALDCNDYIPSTPESTNSNKILRSHDEFYWELFEGGFPSGNCTRLVKKELWYSILPLMPKKHIVSQEDFIDTMLLLYNAKKIITTPYIGYAYYNNPTSATSINSLSQEKKIKLLNDYDYVYNFIENFMKDKGLWEKFGTDFLNRKRTHWNW